MNTTLIIVVLPLIVSLLAACVILFLVNRSLEARNRRLTMHSFQQGNAYTKVRAWNDALWYENAQKEKLITETLRRWDRVKAPDLVKVPEPPHFSKQAQDVPVQLRISEKSSATPLKATPELVYVDKIPTQIIPVVEK